ncbi:MAG: hypothetical protein ACK559_03960, partial [bacterium]
MEHPTGRQHQQQAEHQGQSEPEVEGPALEGRILQAEEQESLVARLVAQVESKKREEAELRRARDAEMKKLNFIRSKIKEKNLDISNLRNDDAAEQPPVGEKFVQPKVITIEFALSSTVPVRHRSVSE